ncbi:hypothetical protein KA478_04880 [Patescibacteria group bacterium]|nr:hypothetical protein [Patescibacteria group bacterium]
MPGTFTIDVSDKDDANIKGQATLVVDTASQTTQPQSTITFSSPSKNGTETNSTISVVGNAGVKNSKVQILLDGTKVKEEQSNQNGDFTSYLTAVQP